MKYNETRDFQEKKKKNPSPEHRDSQEIPNVLRFQQILTFEMVDA